MGQKGLQYLAPHDLRRVLQRRRREHMHDPGRWKRLLQGGYREYRGLRKAINPPRDVTTVDRLGWRRRQSQSVVIIVWREVVRRMVVNQTDVGSLVTMQRRHDNIDVPK